MHVYFNPRAKSKDRAVKQEVGDASKLAQSFERIRDLVRKRRQQRIQEQKQNENNSRLEQIVREVMQRRAEEEAFKTGEASVT